MSKEEAQRRVDLFERTEGRELVKLAGHAALPVALDPTFVPFAAHQLFSGERCLIRPNPSSCSPP